MPVTDDDIAHVQAAFDQFNARFEQLRTREGLQAYHSEFFVPELVIDNVEHFPLPTTYEGFEGYQHWFDETLAPYTDVEWEVESLTPLNDRVLAMALIRGRQPGDPTLLEVRLALLYALQEGRISRIDVFLSRDAAEAAADAPA